MFFKTTKKYFALIIIFISFSVFIKINAQVPVYIVGSEPYIKFWVTTDPLNNEYPTTLKVKDEDLVKILENIASTTENLYAETLRNNYWTLYNEETRNEKEQSIAKYKALKLENLIEENILSWVNEGFNIDKEGQNGHPAYIEDEAVFFDNIEIKMRENFQKLIETYYQYAPEDEKNYLEKISKILRSKKSSILDVSDYYLEGDDESLSDDEVEGWDNWLGLNTDKFTNPVIAFLIAKENLDDLINTEKDKYRNEIANGNGFLSFKKCNIEYYNIETGQLGYDGEDEPPPGDSFYGDPYYVDNIWSSAPGATYPVVSCTTIIPGYLIAEQVSDIYRSKYNFIKQTAINTDGSDLVLDSIQEELKEFQKDIFKTGIVGKKSSEGGESSYKKLNDAIEKASEELKKRDGGNTKISEDTDDPRNTNSRFYPKNFLTGDKWKEIWDFKQNTNNDWYGWFDSLYDWYSDNWKWDSKKTQ